MATDNMQIDFSLGPINGIIDMTQAVYSFCCM